MGINVCDSHEADLYPVRIPKDLVLQHDWFKFVKYRRFTLLLTFFFNLPSFLSRSESFSPQKHAQMSHVSHANAC